MDKLLKFIKNREARKTPMVTLSVNLERKHQAWVKHRSINLSKLVRALLDKLASGETIDLEIDGKK